VTTPSPARLDADGLIALARQADPARPCRHCGELICPGWESMPGAFDRKRLHLVATLRGDREAEPTLREHHPHGTHGWSAEAPIAPAFHPYNRCDVWQCPACARAYLRYTEYGGYYEDERVRWVDPDLVDGTGASSA
jgi:hypothetical protein